MDCEHTTHCHSIHNHDDAFSMYRLDKVEMRGWVASDVTQQAHDEAKELLQRIDKDKVSVNFFTMRYIGW